MRSAVSDIVSRQRHEERPCQGGAPATVSGPENVATPAAIATLVADVRGSGAAIHEDTASEYLEALERLMIVEDQPAWAPHLRSRDDAQDQAGAATLPIPSLAVAALRAHSEAPHRRSRILWIAVRVDGQSGICGSTRKAVEAEVFHYREKGGLEVDAIVEADDGRWAAFEVKLGERWVDEGARNLRRLAARMVVEDAASPPP